MNSSARATVIAAVSVPVVIVAGAALGLSATVTWMAAALIAGAIYLSGKEM